MLIIKFKIRNSIITWFVNENWITVISFALTFATILSIRILSRRIKGSEKKIKMANPKGGGNLIDECIEPDSIYELIDPSLEIIVRRVLKLPPETGPLIISGPVFLFSYIILKQPLKQISINGIQAFVDMSKDQVVKAAISGIVGAVSAAALGFTGPGLITLTGGFLSLTIMI